MKLQHLTEATYDTRGRVFSQKFTLIDPAADRAKPYVYFIYGDVRHDKLPRKSVYFDSAELTQEFVNKKKRVFETKIQKLEADRQKFATPGPGLIRNLEEAHESLEILRRARVVSVTVKYEN